MKIFTRLFLSIALLSASNMLTAQYDVAVTEVFCLASQSNTVPDGFTTLISYRFENLGDSLTPTDTFVAGLIINNDTVVGPLRLTSGAGVGSGNVYIFPDNLIINGDPDITWPYTFEGPNGTEFDICAYAFLPNLIDNNGANNYICRTTITIDNNVSSDLALTGLKLVTPTMAELDSFDIDNDKNTPPAIEDMEIKLVNNSDFDFSDYGLSLKIWLGNESYDGAHAPAIFAPGDTSILNIVNPNVIPETPDKVGLYKMCVAYNTLNDDPSNDTSCFSFRIIDTYIPPPPVGVEETVDGNALNIRLVENQLWITDVQNPVSVTVTDVNGRVVLTQRMIEDGNLQINEAAGVYIVRAVDTESMTEQVQKVSLR